MIYYIYSINILFVLFILLYLEYKTLASGWQAGKIIRVSYCIRPIRTDMGMILVDNEWMSIKLLPNMDSG